VFDWLKQRPEIDLTRVGVSGNSFGSFFSTVMVGNEPRFKACAVTSPNLEPGCHTIFEEASPTFKQRFMYMAQISDEDSFDEFRQTLSWHGHAEKIRVPYLCVGGESDELAPIRNVEQMFAAMSGPRQLVIYQDSRHAIGGVPSATLGPYLPTLVADWMAARLAGTPLRSERWFVDTTGKVSRSAL
jgi:dipeptidyl aminopeptidase/acylaminoacyl peptidase